MTANSFTSVSLEPPLISVCVAEHAHLLPLVKEKRIFGINVLKEGQEELSEYFACAVQPERGAAGINVRFLWTPQNIPLMENVLCQIACRLYATHVTGDHTIVIGEVLSTSLYPGQPLLFFRGDYARLEP
jgi:flavin reductase (DIM6/NTAB) family NADH-FMN oxidoreductase RutF